MRIHDLSRVTHRWATGQDRSWCARIWQGWERDPACFVALMILGPHHVRESWRYYHS